MSLKWAINGILDDIYFMAQGLPRVLFTWKPENQLSILNLFEKNVKKYPNEIAFIFKDQSTTWQEADEKVSRYGAYLQAQGIEKGDCFALLMDNSADFLMLLLAAHRIGAIAALINTTVTGEGLKHVVTIVDLMPDPPFHYIFFIILGVAMFYIIYSPFYLRDKLK